MTRRVRLGIDGEALRRPLSGVGQYVFHLCRELEALLPDAQLFAYSRLPAERLEIPSARWRLRCESRRILRRLPSFLWLKTRGAELCSADRLDVFWAGRTLHPRLPQPVRTVCTVHDLNHLLAPATMQRATYWSHRAWFAGDLRRADCLVANSWGTAHRLRAAFGLSVHGVVQPGLDERFHPLEHEVVQAQLAELGVTPPYFLSVATLEPRKNVRALLCAFVELKRRGELAGHRLVLAGARGWKSSALGHELESARAEGVQVLGYVAAGAMPALYAGATALVFPSLYEGFGMPVLEARACGTRVVVADSPELCEAGGPNAITVPPTVAGVREGVRIALATPPPRELLVARQHAWRERAQCLAELLLRPAS